MLPSSPDVDSEGGCSVTKRTEAPHPNGVRKFRSVAEIMRASKPAEDVTEGYYTDVRCQECRSGDRDEAMLLCDHCDLGYHFFCLRPIVVRVSSGPWFCPSCDDEKPLRSFPLMQTKIVDFFRIQKCTDGAAEGKCGSCSQAIMEDWEATKMILRLNIESRKKSA